MARLIHEEFQDKEGNVHYMHTDDSVVWCENGKSLRENMNKVDFEDYTGDGAETPSAELALSKIVKGKKWSELFSNIKAFCKGVVLLSRVLDSENITEDGYLMSGKKCSEMFQKINSDTLHIVSFDASTGTLITKSSDYNS